MTSSAVNLTCYYINLLTKGHVKSILECLNFWSLFGYLYVEEFNSDFHMIRYSALKGVAGNVW